MIRSLQAGRGLAALAVTAFHLSLMFADPRYGNEPVLIGLTGRGNLGVDFFFVLSGFIIMMAHHDDIGKPGCLRQFTVKRFIRVYPLYWFFTAAILLGSSLTGGSNAAPATLGEVASTLSLVHFVPYSVPLGPAWTLFFEILFYAMFAVLIFNRRIGLLSFGVWFALVLANFQRPEHGSWTFWNTLTSTSNLNFLGGIVAYNLANRLAGKYAVIILGSGIMALPAIFACETILGRGALLHILYGIAFTLIIAGAVAKEREGKMPVVPSLGLLGNASYTLYLAHESVGSILLKISDRLGLIRTVDHRLLYVAIIATIVLFALAFYTWIEKPMLGYLRGAFETGRQKPIPETLPV